MINVNPSDRVTLVLNEAYMPSHVITARLAFNHILTGRGWGMDASGGVHKSLESWDKVGQFSEDQPALRSAEKSWAVPTIIIAGPAFFRRTARGSKKLSELVKRYNYTCQITGKKYNKGNWRKHFSIEHVLPVSKGGTNEDWNYLPTSIDANRKKGDQYPYYDVNGVNLEDKIKKPNNFIYVEKSEYRKEWGSFHLVKTYG